jgi:hypothetical protein
MFYVFKILRIPAKIELRLRHEFFRYDFVTKSTSSTNYLQYVIIQSQYTFVSTE